MTTCMHCHSTVTLINDYWIAEDGSGTCSIEQRRAAGTAPPPDVFDMPEPRLGGQSYREATRYGSCPVLSSHLMPFVHLPEPDWSWTEADPRFAHYRPAGARP